MQNLLKQIKQNFKINNFETYKNCIGERVYSFDIGTTAYTFKREFANKKLYELRYKINDNYGVSIETNRNITKQDVINKIKELNNKMEDK